MKAVYLVSLLVSSGALVLVDRRWRLLWWDDARRTAIVLVTGVAVLLGADLVGIANGLFFRAPSRVMTGVLLAPELPLEEPVFLAFLCYLCLLLVRGAERLLPTAAPGAARDRGTAHDARTARLHAGAGR